MTGREEFLSALRETVGRSLLQESPYPVVAPRTIDQAEKTIMLAREHQHKVLVLGNGTTFPADFTILRENVVAIMSAGLADVQTVTPFSVRVLSGTPVSNLIRGKDTGRRTLGGVLCGSGRGDDALLRALWTRVRSLEVLTASGSVQRFAAAGLSNLEDPGSSSLFVGSAGRLGMIVAAEMASPLPVSYVESDGDKNVAFEGEAGGRALGAKDAQSLLDPGGLFQW